MANSSSSIMAQFTKAITTLDLKEKEVVLETLKASIFSEKNTFSEKIKEHKRTSCPHCESKEFSKNGLSKKGIQTYICKASMCAKFFSDSSGQSIHWIHRKNDWYHFIDLMFDGEYRSIRKMAEVMNMSTRTVFDWRHKILGGLDLAITEGFNGIVEIDDLLFIFSEKGRRGLDKTKKRGGKSSKRGDSSESVKVLATSDRVNTMKFDFVRIGRLKAKDIENCLGDLLDNDLNILTSDKHPSIKSYAKKKGIKHESFLAKNHSRGVYHVNTVNQKARELKNLMNDTLKGVSTKYLQNYLNWFKMIQLKSIIELDMFNSVFMKTNAWYDFHNREENYQTFIANFSDM